MTQSRMRWIFRHTLAFIVLFVSSASAQSPDILAQHIVGNYRVQKAREMLDMDYDAIRMDAVRFAEARTAEELTAACADAFKQSGLLDVTRDDEGNVLGLRKGSTGDRTIAIAVRLPSRGSEDHHIRVQDSRLTGAGIADSYTLALFLDSIRVLNAARIETAGNILFVITAGSNMADRRKFLETLIESSNYKGRISAFVEFEPLATNAIITESPASRLYRISLSGTLTEVDTLQSELGGIPSVHSVRSSRTSSGSQIHVEAQAAGGTGFAGVDSDLRRIMQEMSRRAPDLQATVETVAEFPAARTNVSLTIVQLATGVMKELHLEPDLRSKFSDAGVAMNAGIPSIGIGSIATDGPPSAPSRNEEWIDVQKDAPGLSGAILIAVGAAFVGVR